MNSGLLESEKPDKSPLLSNHNSLPDSSSSHRLRLDHLGPFARILLAGLVLFLSAGFALALQLEPDSRGYGTHQRLGLPPCTFLFLFGIPCPSCGMTTSFAHFVRGEFVPSLQANWVGTILATTCALMIPWATISVVLGRTWKIKDPIFAALVLLATICGLSLINWIFIVSRNYFF